MKLPAIVCDVLFDLLYRYVARRRRPDQIIGDDGPYMLRWWLFGTSKELDEHGEKKPRRPFGYSFYFHCFLRSDDDRALHDHPWPYTTLILRTGYREHRDEVPVNGCVNSRGGVVMQVSYPYPYNPIDPPPTARVIRTYRPGAVISSKASDAHRVQLLPQDRDSVHAFSDHRIVNFPWMENAESWYAYERWREEKPCFTLFVAGKWERKWGFLCRDENGVLRWKWWRDFDRDGGCGEREHGHG